MFKVIVAAAVATGASAQLNLGANGLTNLLLLDQLSSNDYYYGNHGSDLLPLLAAGGSLGSTTNLNDYILWDRVTDRHGDRFESLPLMALTGNAAAAQEIFLLDRMSRGSHNKILPMAVMSNNINGFGSDMTKLWAMNRYGGGDHHDFNNLASMSTMGLTTPAQATSLWGVQQMREGHNTLAPLMAATRDLPTTMEGLWTLDAVSPARHGYGYGRRHHGYTRHQPVRHQPVRHYGHRAPVVQQPVQRFASAVRQVVEEEEEVVEDVVDAVSP